MKNVHIQNIDFYFKNHLLDVRVKVLLSLVLSQNFDVNLLSKRGYIYIYIYVCVCVCVFVCVCVCVWCWGRMEKISWTNHVRKEEVLLRVKEQRFTRILHEISNRKANWIGNILRINCLLQRVVEGKIKGGMEMTGR